MRKKIIVDSSYLFALAYEKDSCHKKALRIKKIAVQENDYYIGMNVYSEILTLVSQRVSKAASIELLTYINQNYNLINPDDDTYIKADSYFRKAKSKNISYSDCISFAIMDQENIELVLGFDEHFKQMGYNRVGIDK